LPDQGKVHFVTPHFLGLLISSHPQLRGKFHWYPSEKSGPVIQGSVSYMEILVGDNLTHSSVEQTKLIDTFQLQKYLEGDS